MSTTSSAREGWWVVRDWVFVRGNKRGMEGAGGLNTCLTADDPLPRWFSPSLSSSFSSFPPLCGYFLKKIKLNFVHFSPHTCTEHKLSSSRSSVALSPSASFHFQPHFLRQSVLTPFLFSSLVVCLLICVAYNCVSGVQVDIVCISVYITMMCFFLVEYDVRAGDHSPSHGHDAICQCTWMFLSFCIDMK